MIGRYPLQESRDTFPANLAKIRIIAQKSDLLLFRHGLVVLAHPLDHCSDFLGIPGPCTKRGQGLAQVYGAASDIVVDRQARSVPTFHHEKGVAHLFDQEFKQPVFELEELACPVRALSKANDADVLKDLLERLQVGKGMAGLEAAQL